MPPLPPLPRNPAPRPQSRIEGIDGVALAHRLVRRKPDADCEHHGRRCEQLRTRLASNHLRLGARYASRRFPYCRDATPPATIPDRTWRRSADSRCSSTRRAPRARRDARTRAARLDRNQPSRRFARERRRSTTLYRAIASRYSPTPCASRKSFTVPLPHKFQANPSPARASRTSPHRPLRCVRCRAGKACMRAVARDGPRSACLQAQRTRRHR